MLIRLSKFSVPSPHMRFSAVVKIQPTGQVAGSLVLFDRASALSRKLDIRQIPASATVLASPQAPTAEGIGNVGQFVGPNSFGHINRIG